MKRGGVITALSVLALTLFAVAAHAFTIRGTVKNGTTGATNVAVHVVAIQPSAGMKEVGVVDAKNGKFVIENVPADAPIVLLRTEYAGVTYNTAVRPTRGDQDVEVEVFESTSSWDSVEITMPHLAAVRRGDALHIEQLFEITNNTAPPRTVSGKDGPFQLYLPADMDSLTESYVVSGEMPLKRIPIPTGKPDIYGIDYPIKPGTTRFSVSYAVPYAKNSYSMKMRFPLPVPHMMVFAVDSSMHVSSTTHTFANQESVHGMSAYALHDLKANSTLDLAFAGGDPDFAGIDVEGEDGDQAGTPQNIRTEPTEDFKLSIFLMVTVLLVLASIVTMALKERRDPLSDPQVLRGHYDLLVSRLAKLDDLHAANTIPDDAYRASREELVGRLAVLAIQLRSQAAIHAHEKGVPSEPNANAQ